jgi:FOG: FHA domain
MRGDHPIGVQLINVSDPTRTVSKTHATLLRTGDDWRIRDEDSTNGVYLVKEDGTETEVKSEGPLSGRFVLGDLVFELETDG